MKKEDLLEAMNNLDDDLLEEALEKPKKGKLINFVRIAMPVAAAVLLIGLLMPVINRDSKKVASDKTVQETHMNVKGENNTPEGEAEEHNTSKGDESANEGLNEEVDDVNCCDDVYGVDWNKYDTLSITEYNRFSENLGRNVTNFLESTNGEIYETNKADNYLYSPFSLYMALMFSEELADASAAKDVLEALGYKDVAELNDSLKYIYRYIEKNEEDASFTIGNSLWLDERQFPKETDERLEEICNRFNASAYNLDLHTKSTVKLINKWMSDNTGGMISEGLKDVPDESTRMLLYNSIYFNAMWKNEIKESDVWDGKFTTSNGEEITASMMHTTEDTRVYTSAHASAAALSYKGGSKMLFIKPNEGESLDTIMGEDLYELIGMCQNEQGENYFVNFTIPKFKAEVKLEGIEGVIRDLGITSLFDEATFSGLGGISVKEINQYTAIEVDENGTKAAAVTEIVYDNAIVIRDSYDMILDSEYAYVILNDENIPLFVGVVNNPCE